MPIASPSYATLSAMITPAIFLTANGSLRYEATASRHSAGRSSPEGAVARAA
jgi:hypothetical protein